MRSLTLIAAASLCAQAAEFPGVRDVPFLQEWRTEVRYPGTEAPRSLAVLPGGSVWIATRGGIYRWDGKSWDLRSGGSCYSLASRGGEIWAGCWDGLRRLTAGAEQRITGIAGPVSAVWADERGVVAMTQSTLHEWDGNRWTTEPWKGARAVRAVVREKDGALWVATSMGAWRRENNRWQEFHDETELVSGELRSAALAPDGSVWLGSNAGVDVYRGGRRMQWFDTSKGMPSQDVRSVAATNDAIWIGTAQGALRRKSSGWSHLHSRRWLPSDDVIAIAPASDGTVWVATAAGLSAIHRRAMTLAEKADHYLAICLKRHVRPPYLVEQCNLEAPGDTAHFHPRDDDNDGQYTAMYLAMESYRYAVTHDPQARKNASQAFRALKFLQEVTGTSGFFARTVVPSDWKKVSDPNETLTPESRADRSVENPRYKVVEQRWRPSADGRWLWKGDTSSDEVTGHFYGYFTYYTLAADDAEKQVIREHVRRIMDYIIEGGYTLRDIDGTPTRWGVWAPQMLNGHPDWRAERWTNGLEILSYLRAAEVMTGDPKYRRHYLDLIGKHGYDRLARRPLATEPADRTQFDNELVALALPAAMTETDSHIRSIFEEALRFWLPRIRPQISSYYNFTWAALSGAKNPAEFGLEDCVTFLRDEPLDLVQWTVNNSRREDVRLVHWPQVDDLQIDRVLPPSERAPMRWDGNPWSAVHGENGMSESSGVHWLLPYWMGRYYGFIRAAER